MLTVLLRRYARIFAFRFLKTVVEVNTNEEEGGLPACESRVSAVPLRSSFQFAHADVDRM